MTRWHKRTTSKQKIEWLAERPKLFMGYKQDQRKTEKRVFEEMKRCGLLAPSTGQCDADIVGYIKMANRRFNQRKL